MNMKCDNFPPKSDNLILDFGWLDPHMSIMREGVGQASELVRSINQIIWNILILSEFISGSASIRLQDSKSFRHMLKLSSVIIVTANHIVHHLWHWILLFWQS